MNNFRNKIKNGFIRFMSGRYGWDQIGAVYITIALILDLIGIFTRVTWLSFIADILLFYELFRMFSRNINAHYRENMWFLTRMKVIRHRFMLPGKNRADKTHKYYVCSKCGQIVRIPKGHGKIEITCPSCKKTFTRKS